MCKTREELRMDALSLGLNLEYEPEIVIDNIFKYGEKAWQESMKNGIGSSGAAAAIGKSPYKSPQEVALEKIIGKSKPIADGDPDKQYKLDSGHMQEVPLLKWYAAQLGYEVALADPANPSTSDIKDISEITADEWKQWEGKGIVCVDHARYVHPFYPFMFTDMDAICIPPSRDTYVLECKTTDTRDYDWLWETGVWPNAKVGNIGYIDQARQHMAVANMNRCDIIVACDFNGAHNKVITVYRDMDDEKRLIDSEAKLWDQITDGIIPEFVTLSDRSFENLSYIMMPERQEADSIKLAESIRSQIVEIFDLEQRMKDLDDEKTRTKERSNALKLSLIPLLGNHQVGVMQGFTEGYEIKVELKSAERKTFDQTRFKLENPDLAEKYVKISVSDPKITVKEVKIKKAK